MLNWQNKKWVKVIAMIVVVTFLIYDIAWAMDFSPLNAPNSFTTTEPGVFSKINNFISKIIFNKTQKEGKFEGTELSFRSQLVPTKKYEERSGFLRLENVKDIIKRQMDEMQKRQQKEKDRSNKFIIDYNINKGIYMNAVEKAIGTSNNRSDYEIKS